MRGTWTAVAVLLAGFLGTIADLSAQEMVFPAADWQGATPGSQGIDPEKLAAAVNYLRKNSGRDGVQELVIIRHGRMIWKGDEIDNVHGVWSCTKSFSSTVLGLLIDDGKCSLNSRAHEFLPELERSYPDVTLRARGSTGSTGGPTESEPTGSASGLARQRKRLRRAGSITTICLSSRHGRWSSCGWAWTRGTSRLWTKSRGLS